MRPYEQKGRGAAVPRRTGASPRPTENNEPGINPERRADEGIGPYKVTGVAQSSLFQAGPRPAPTEGNSLTGGRIISAPKRNLKQVVFYLLKNILLQ